MSWTSQAWTQEWPIRKRMHCRQSCEVNISGCPFFNHDAMLLNRDALGRAMDTSIKPFDYPESITGSKAGIHRQTLRAEKVDLEIRFWWGTIFFIQKGTASIESLWQSARFIWQDHSANNWIPIWLTQIRKILIDPGTASFSFLSNGMKNWRLPRIRLTWWRNAWTFPISWKQRESSKSRPSLHE